MSHLLPRIKKLKHADKINFIKTTKKKCRNCKNSNNVHSITENATFFNLLVIKII